MGVVAVIAAAVRGHEGQRSHTGGGGRVRALAFVLCAPVLAVVQSFAERIGQMQRAKFFVGNCIMRFSMGMCSINY
jgi:hypothetical protein